MAVDMFLKIETPNLEGESSDSTHEGEIDVLAWSWGVSQSGSMHVARGGGAGKVNVQDISLTKWIDSASPNLLQHCAMGTQFATATLTCRRASGTGGQIEYLVIVLHNVIVTSVSCGGSGGEDRFTENASLNFAKYEVTYTPQDNDGSALPEIGPVGWDIQKNEAV
jgi:type VI secretion system secreted protein Hcp